MLRTEFDFGTETEGRAAHKADSKRVHTILNWMSYADDPTYETLQDCVDDTPDFGTILVPPGVTEFDTVDIGSKTITLQGYGGFLPYPFLPGGSAWNNSNYTRGSVLKSTATEGIAIEATNGRLHLKDLAIVGANGQTTGVKCGIDTNPQRVLLRWSNVQFGNFAVGAALDNMYEGHYSDLAFRGCGIGFHLNLCNASVLTGCSVSVAEIGIHLESSSTVTVTGGAIQGVTDTGLLVEDSEECTVQGVYFENKDAQYAINTSGVSDNLTLLNNHASTFSNPGVGAQGDRIRVGSNFGFIRHGKYGSKADGTSNLILDGNYNVAYVGWNHSVIENNGVGNVINTLGPA